MAAGTNGKAPTEAPTEATKKLPGQDAVRNFYHHDLIQIGVAVLISANFLTNIACAQIDPSQQDYETEWKVADYGFNTLFTIELCINIYANWFWAFWQDGWNRFDVVVVSIGLVNMIWEDLPKFLSLLRMMRAFRIFRLFNRIQSLKKNIQAILGAIPGVVNNFLILTIIICIYAILGVEVFIDIGEDCDLAGREYQEWVDSKVLEDEFEGTLIYPAWHPTNRGQCLGQEYFGSFTKSWLTLFQILTGDSWSENIARPVIWWYWADGGNASSATSVAGSSFYFVSFIIISCFILLNVVVAVLLDKMSEAAAADEAASKDESDEDSSTPVVNLTAREVNAHRQSVGLRSNLSSLSSKTCSLQVDFISLRKDVADLREQLAMLATIVEPMDDAAPVRVCDIKFPMSL